MADKIERDYYSNGQLCSETPYSEGQAHGILKAWWADGRRWYKVTFYEGQRHGIAEYWYKDGRLFHKGYYLYNDPVIEEEYRRHELIKKLSGL